MLNTLTDEQLAYLGVSPEGDIMSITVYRDKKKEEKDEQNAEGEAPAESAEPEKEVVVENKLVFRYYVAELEDFYNVNSRSISVELFN